MIGPLLVALVASLAGTGEPGDWPGFLGPGGRGVAEDGVPLPAALDESSLRWRIELEPGHASPVTHGARAYLCGAGDGGLTTVCVNLADGEVLWRRALAPLGEERLHEINSAASPTPAVDSEGVYAYFGSAGLVSYDHAGVERWRRPLAVPRNTFGTAASPVLAGGRLVLNHDANDEAWTAALDPTTGETLWRVEREGDRSGWSTPAVWRRGELDELLVYTPRRLIAYALEDGAERWSTPGLTDEPCTTPATGAGLVFVTSYNMKTSPEVIGLPSFEALVGELDASGDGLIDRAEAEANQSVLSRFDAGGEGDHPLRIFFRWLDADRSGALDAGEYAELEAWVDSFDFVNGLLAVRPGGGEAPAQVAWQHTRGVPECPSPLFVEAGGEPLLYMVKNGGILTCLAAGDGAERYRTRLAATGPYYASPVAGDGKLYVCSAGGVVTTVALGPELEVLARSDLGERIMSTPALGGGRVLIRTETGLWSFAAPTDAPPEER